MVQSNDAIERLKPRAILAGQGPSRMACYVTFELVSFLGKRNGFLPVNAAYKKTMHAKAINGYLMNAEKSAPTLSCESAPYVDAGGSCEPTCWASLRSAQPTRPGTDAQRSTRVRQCPTIDMVRWASRQTDVPQHEFGDGGVVIEIELR